jgi:hypothetical protein
MAELLALRKGRHGHAAEQPRAADSGQLADSSGDLRGRHRTVLMVAVLANYAAQVPYALDLYGTHVNLGGVALLGATLAWFLTGVVLQRKGRRAGYWVLLSFLVAEFLFYFHGQILGITNGYGLVYLIVHAHDAIVRAVFLVGDVNFIVAGYFAVYLIRQHRRAARS